MRIKQKSSYFIFLLLSFVAFSQEVVLEKEIEDFKIKKAFQVVNDHNNNLAFFLDDKTTIKSYLFNSNFEKIDSLTGNSLPKKYKILVGSSIRNDNDYRLYSSNSTYTKFGVLQFSFSKREIISTDLDIQLKNERFLTGFTYNDIFHVLTIKKNSSILNIYQFNENEEATIKTFDFSKERFRHWNHKLANMYTLMSHPFGTEQEPLIVKIDNTHPSTFGTNAEPSKIYVRGNKLVITLDSNRDYTQIVKINLDTDKQEYTGISKPLIKSHLKGKKSNSLLFGDHFFSIAVLGDEFKFEVKNLETKKLLKAFTLKRDRPIVIKNSAIIIDEGFYSDYREVQKTSQFFRKIDDYDVAITISETESGNYEIRLGGVTPKGSIVLNIGAYFKVGPISFNPMWAAYKIDLGSRSTYIKCLFNKSFEHLEGETKPNAFDKIKSFPKEQDILAQTEIIFRLQDNIFYGYRIPYSSKYKILKF